MFRKQSVWLLAAASLPLWTSQAIAQSTGPTATATTSSTYVVTTTGTVSSKQSTYKPYGYKICSKVYASGSDSFAASFNTNTNNYLTMISQLLPEGVAYTGAGLNKLDPERLYFYFSYSPRVYFLNDGAGYHNTLGVTIATVTAPTSSQVTGTSYTVFPDGSMPSNNTRSTYEPLLVGDYVQLPNIAAGQQLAFFLGSNMDSKGVPSDTFYNGASNNSDKYQHLIAFFPDNSQYIIIGWEDLWGGGDMDCNDLMFAVDVGPNNAAVWRQANSLPK